MADSTATAVQLTDQLRRLEPDIACAILERIRRDVPDAARDSDPERVAAMRATIHAAVTSAFSRIAEGRSVVGEPPPQAWENVRLAARWGLSLSATLSSYVTGHLVTWEFIVDQAERLDLDRHERIALLKRVSFVESGYFNELVALVSDAYMREHDRVALSRGQRRVQLVQEVLGGGEVTTNDLSYDMTAHHNGLVLSGGDSDEVARQLASGLDRRLLVVSRTGTLMWAWLAGQLPLSADACVMEARPFAASGMSIGVGECASGIDGFRLTHRQALAAYAVARCRRDSIARYADIALVALAQRDRHLGAGIAELYLAPLDDEPRRSGVLRKTLRAYFAANQNAASAAAALGIHERTVGYRLRTVETKLGQTIHSRRAELDVALRRSFRMKGCVA